MEKSIADRLKEFKTASSARGESTASGNFERHSNQSNVFTPGAYRPQKPRPGYSQDAHSSRPSAPPSFDAQRPPARPLNSSVPFPVPPTVPVFDPSAPPPGLPPFAVPPPSAAGCGASGSMPPPPPSFPPHSRAAGAHPQNNLGAVPQQGSFGAAPWQNSMGAFPPQHSRGNVSLQNSAGGVPPPQSNSGNMPRQNSFGNVPPQSNFGNVPLPSNFGNNFGNVPPQSSFGNVPPQNNFGNVPPQSSFGNVPPQNNFGNTPPQNNFGNVPPQNNFGNVPPQNNFGNIPPPNNFGNVPPPNNFGNIPPPNNFGNAVSQAAGGLSSSTQHSSFPPYTVPEGQVKFSSPPPCHHPLPEPTVSDSGKVKADQCDVGAQQDVLQWLKNTGKLKDHEAASGSKDEADGTAAAAAAESDVAQKKRRSLSIGQAHKKLRCVLHSLAAVQGELQQLKEEQATLDTETWEARVLKIRQLKEAYFEAKREVDVSQLKDLKRKLDDRRKKRDRQRRRKQEDKELEQQTLFERAQKHAAIDQWRNQILQEHLNQQQVKQMKEMADKTLSKVRREIRETRKMLDTVNRLQKLRAVRNDTAEKRGQLFPPSVAEHFTEKTNDLAQLLTRQIEAFEKEEAALKLLLETEKQEAKEKEEEEKRQKEKEMRQSEMEEEKLCLFGLSAQPHPGDPMLPFANYYHQAQYNFHSFVSIRKEWDTFLVSERTPMASRIPDGWVIPEPPSSSVWASAMQPQAPNTAKTS